MRVGFTPDGWNDYRHWVDADARMARSVNRLIEECRRTPFTGLGKPEPLRGEFAGWWSRRITQEHRLIYRVTGSGAEQRIEIAQCRFHH